MKERQKREIEKQVTLSPLKWDAKKRKEGKREGKKERKTNQGLRISICFFFSFTQSVHFML